MIQEKKRIQWIDLAKGFCILLVVLQHASELTEVDYPLSVQAFGFRMPLYFILSGLFFKQYEGFAGFLKRKTNKLLIPFVFFFIVTSVIPYWVLDRMQHWPYVFKFFYREERVMFNGPIWFLLCLFEVNILFYFVQWLSGRISAKHKVPIVLALSLVIGFTGLMLGVYSVNLHLYFDTMLSVLPFFAFGWWLLRHSNVLTSPVNYKRDIPVAIGCALVLLFFATPVKWLVNRVTVYDLPVVYLCGIAGTMMVLLVSKMIGRLPLISYWGRYSIMVLCSHNLVLYVMCPLLKRYLSGGALLFVSFAVAMLACHLLIPLMRRFLPHVTAQKDLIKV